MNTHDLCDLEDLDDESALYAIKDRYNADIFYTSIGDVLVAVNPNKDTDIYSKEVSHQYKVSSCSNLPPHIFKLSSRIYQSMLISSDNQCFIASGESGSGKTETTKHVLQHFLTSCTMEDRKLIKKIEKVNIVLEAFGSAKTPLNCSSTRFAKFLQIYFSSDRKACGAKMTEYLLEKSRVTDYNKGEQNFHIFYYMFAGRTDEELSKHLIESPAQHRYLKYGETFGDELFDWSQKFGTIMESLTVIGFSAEDISAILGTLSAILNIGDIAFGSQEHQPGVYVENLAVLDKVALLLGVVTDDLEMCLTSKSVNTRNEAVSSFKNTPEVNACRESLAQALYDRLFGWIVCRMNEFMNTKEEWKKKSEYTSVGFLDMFGFEDLECNSLEQLCINVANEQLQLHFTQNVFALEQLEYEQEEIAVEPINYTDNKDIINLLLEKPYGIFALLEEECKCAQADANTLISKLNAHCWDQENYVKSVDGEPVFAVVHYTNKVTYAADHLLEKNGDKVDRNIIDCLKCSKEKLISSLFHSSVLRTGSLSYRAGTGTSCGCHGDLRDAFNKRQQRRSMRDAINSTNKASRNVKMKPKRSSSMRKPKPLPSIVMQFRNSLVDLMERILLCQAHFVRCVKPNNTQESNSFDEEYVMNQMKYMGVLETMKIRKHGFPVRLLFKTFIDRYQVLVPPVAVNVEPTAENCGRILDSLDITGWKAGKTKIFLQLSHVQRLTLELQALAAKVVMAQKMVRGHLARIDFDFLQTTRKQEERSLGNLLVSISSKSSKMYDNLVSLNEMDVKRNQEKKEKELKKKDLEKENPMQKRKLTDPVPAMVREKSLPETSPTRKVSKNKTKPSGDVIVRNFTSSSMSAWCRVDCYERQYHIASFQMDQAVICVDGTHPVSDKNRIAFASLQSRWDDPKVVKVKSCIGKGVQMHQDEKQNLWATRLGKNPIFVRGHTLCPELVKLNGKLTQGVPMKVLDTAAFKEDMKREVEVSGVNEEVKEKIMSRLKVCMSFIKDTVVDEETPCWFEIWLLKVKDSVKRYLDSYQKRREQEEKRKSAHHTPKSAETTPSRNGVPPMRRSKSGDQLKSSVRRSRCNTANASCRMPNGHDRLANGIDSRLANGHDSRLANGNEGVVNGNDSPATKIARGGNVVQNGTPPSSIRAPFWEQDSRRRDVIPDMRREKSMDVRLEQRLLRERRTNKSASKGRKDSKQNSPVQSINRTEDMDTKNLSNGIMNHNDVNMSDKYEKHGKTSRVENGNFTPSSSIETDTPTPLETDNKPDNKRTYVTPKAGMSYRQVFGIQSSDYIFNITPPNYTRHRRYSDSDTESLQNFVSRIIPQDDKPRVLQNMQPKKWMKKARRKSEDQPKRKLVAQLLSR